MPRVEFPAAEPAEDAMLAAVATPLLSQENVYLLRVAKPPQQLVPSANIPTVPDAAPTLTPKPQLLAEVAPNAIGDGIALSSLKLG